MKTVSIVSSLNVYHCNLLGIVIFVQIIKSELNSFLFKPKIRIKIININVNTCYILQIHYIQYLRQLRLSKC